MSDMKITSADLNVQSAKRSQRIAKIIRLIITYTFLSIMALIVIFPFYWMIISSLKTVEEYRFNVPTLWPQTLDFANYSEAFSTANLWQLFKNTMFVGVVSTILSLVVTVLSAFAFARLQFKGKNVVFGLLMATMMVPGELYTITNYLTVTGNLPFAKESLFDLRNTFIVLIVPMLVSVFYIYLLRQTFMQIPNELYLAAKVDGTSDFKYLWKVMLPLSVSTVITITILKMMGAWNAYIWPKLVTFANDPSHQLITNGLRNAFKIDENGMADYPVQMAAVALVSIPLFLVFVFLRKYIMRGVSRSGIKG